MKKVPPAEEKRCHCCKVCTATKVKKSNFNCNIMYKDSLSYKRSPLVIVEIIESSENLEISCIHSFKVIEFGDSYEAPKEDAATVSASDGFAKKKGHTVAVTIEDMQKRKNDVKARTTLLLSLHDEHQLRFSKYKTAQELWAAILKTFGGNEATKKTKKNLLKKQYGNFKAEGTDTLEQNFNSLQVIVSQLKFMGIEIEQDDLNQKFLTTKNSSEKEEVNTASVPTNVSPASVNIGATPKALMAIDGVGWVWSYMANEDKNHTLVDEEEAPTKFALMAKTSAESEEGLGYSAVPPPPAQVYYPPKKDMSWIGLPEFVDDTITDYSRPSPTIESKSDDLQNRNPSVTETEPLTSTIMSKPDIKFVKATDRTTETKTTKLETAKPAVKYAKLYRKPSKGSKARGN
nr:ribonuclease H-like domain-containing protein [Tanacetum cinerariifolium]